MHGYKRNQIIKKDLLQEISRVLDQYPELRLGQIIYTCVAKSTISDMFLIHDESFIDLLIQEFPDTNE